MIAAARLWWLLRSMSGPHRDREVAVSYGILTWSLLATTCLVAAIVGITAPGSALHLAALVLAAALLLTGALATRTLLTHRSVSDRLGVIRASGATRRQMHVMSALDVADSAWPGILGGLAAHVLLSWLFGHGVGLHGSTSPLLVVPVLVLVAARHSTDLIADTETSPPNLTDQTRDQTPGRTETVP